MAQHGLETVGTSTVSDCTSDEGVGGSRAGSGGIPGVTVPDAQLSGT